MMLARQKAMLATVVAISLIITLTTVAYIAAADRVGREHLAPQISQAFADLIQIELTQQRDDMVLRSVIERMTQHYQISEVALYNPHNQRLLHSYNHDHNPGLPPQLTDSYQQPWLKLYRINRQSDSNLSETFTLAIVSQVSLPSFFLLDTVTTSLFVVSFSALIVFLLYLTIRKWQRQPYRELLAEVHKHNHKNNDKSAGEKSNKDEPIHIQTQDPDIQPLVHALNDLFWLRDQRHLHLKSAHQQAESARLRATRLSDETRMMNDNLAKEVSVRRGIEVQLKNTQLLLDSILNAMPSAIFALDKQLRVVQCNQQAGFWLQTDSSQLIGRPLYQLIPELEQQPLLTHSDTRRTKDDHNKIERVQLNNLTPAIIADVQLFLMENDQQAHYVIRIDDISQRQRMEEIMVQTEKMMSVGGLAAGMAHEINNPLGAMLQNLQNIRRRLLTDLPANQRIADELGLEPQQIASYAQRRDIDKLLDNIQDAGERAARIIRSMLQFARNDHLQKSWVNVRELVDTTLTIAATDVDLKQSQLHKQVADNLPDVYCVPSEIEQVLLNLIKNAQQAIDKQTQFSTEQTVSSDIRIHASLNEEYVCIAVEDNGPGIPAEVAAHIFEPFYTTKDVGEGTGLGLSVSYFIITAHHQGKLIYQPLENAEQSSGSRFEIQLPL
ncbi:two-component system sensor histidine kinase NtrB [Bacterioplanoides sp.]|uniref:two-component system sensor histidine kinase NtrB n=1 Tax=Bacterioplanoides sp. TaxID=2066072 RepID=UPI003B5CE6E9